MGNALYSARFVLFNKIGITDKLASIYSNPAVIPFLGREVAPAPSKPHNVSMANGQLTWHKSGDDRSVVYHFTDLKKEGKVVTVTTATSLPVTAPGYYCVTTINADNRESAPSDIAEKK